MVLRRKKLKYESGSSVTHVFCFMYLYFKILLSVIDNYMLIFQPHLAHIYSCRPLHDLTHSQN